MAGLDSDTQSEVRWQRRRCTTRHLLAAALGATAALLLSTASALAADVTYYASPSGSGDCSSAALACSLTTAQSNAAASSGNDVTIALAAGTYSASPPEVDVTSGSESSLTFDGAGMSSTILDGGGSARTAFLNVAFPVTLENLELENGSAASSASQNGGNLDDEDASATLTLQDVLILDGQAACGGGIYFGDGHTLTIIDSEIVDNSIPLSLAPACGYGAGLFTEASSFTEMVRSTVADNSDDTGSGGAGISSSSAGLSIQDSTIAGNTCSTSCDGTALFLGFGTAQTFGDTIAGSTSLSPQLYVHSGATLQIGGSIVAGNANAECVVATSPLPAGQIVDEGYNIADDNTNCKLTASTSQPNVSDQTIGLGILTENGGPTPTMQVSSSSAAYDVVPTNTQLTGDDTDFCSRYDQREIPRAQAGASKCSAGAYQFAPPTLSLVLPSSDEGGGTVTIAGTNLQYASSVTFGNTNAPGTITSQSPNELTATVPILSPGSQPITVTSADGSAHLPFTLLANPQVTTTTLPEGEVGAAYASRLTASGGAPPLTWTASAPLPAGLMLSADGTIDGTPTATGPQFGVVVTDSNGVTATRSLQITVVPAVTIATLSLPAGVAGVHYRADLQVASGTGAGPYAWSVAGGSLPTGLVLSPDGEISGVPRSAARTAVVVKVTDGLGGRAHASLELTVNPGAPPELTDLRQTHEVFAVGSAATALSALAPGWSKPVKKVAIGTVFSFKLNQAASVTIEIKRLGVRECKTGRAKHRGRSKCVAPIHRLRRSEHAGADRIPFSGRVKRRALAPGRYRASFVASNANGSSKQRTLTFKIVKR